MRIIIAMLIILISQSAFSQITKTTDKATNTMKSAEGTLTTADNTIKSTKNIVKEILGKSGEGKNKIAIIIAGIDYDDPVLKSLKNAVEKIKGVQGMAMNYKDGIATILATFKPGVSVLWDKVNFTGKEELSIAEMGDKALSLNYHVKESESTADNK